VLDLGFLTSMAKDVPPRAEEVQGQEEVGPLGTYEVGSLVLTVDSD
jgi:hypothetical protein